MAALLATLAVVCLAIISQRSFVGTAPLNEGSTQDFSASGQDASVRELESLKHTLGKTLAMMKTQSSVYTDINGQKEEHTDRREEVKENGKLIARVGQHMDTESRGPNESPTGKIRMDLDIPSKGIHKSSVQQLPPEYQAVGALAENVNRRSPIASSSIGIEALTESGNNVDRYNTLSGAQYSPLDMAEYVFWTGDEKGVTLAIEEFLQEGLMTREEAITFLQEIKNNLDYLKNHYTQLGLNSREHSKNPDVPFKYPSYGNGGKNNAAVASSASDKQPELRSTFDINQLRQEVNKKRGAPAELSHPSGMMGRENRHKPSDNDRSQEEDYEELLERLRVADFLYTEYSLEEVIYQLAKVMFTQSLTRGSAEAQQALQKFTNFLEMEAEQGHISRALEKKVLDVLIASLSDTLSEHPELLSTARESLGPSSFPTATNADVAATGQHFLRQILEISPEDKATTRASSLYSTKEHETGSRSSQSLRDQIKEMNMAAANHVSMGLGKYKNP